MIFAVRLRPYNKKSGNKMKTYLSGHSRTKYTVGVGQQPSPIRIVTDKKEIHELREYSQFEFLPFENRKELDRFVNREVLVAARKGKPVVKPVITNGPQDPDSEPQEEPDDVDMTVASIFDEFTPDELNDSKGPSVDDALEDGDKNFTPKESAPVKNTGRKTSKGASKTGAKTSTKKKSAAKKKP